MEIEDLQTTEPVQFSLFIRGMAALQARPDQFQPLAANWQEIGKIDPMHPLHPFEARSRYPRPALHSVEVRSSFEAWHGLLSTWIF